MNASARVLLCCLILLGFLKGLSQPIVPDSLTILDPEIRETSGLLYLNGKLITHNDSGGEPTLYEVDTLTGQIRRKVLVSNASNVDWEDICKDDQYLYIGDFGNNLGERRDLRIYRVALTDYLQMDTILADTIQFSYQDQNNFIFRPFSTNYDAEAIMSRGDSLYLFSKNWGNQRTNIYPIPKQPGTYIVAKVDSLDSQGLVTGAVFDQMNQELWLCGYSSSEPFLIHIDSLHTGTFSQGRFTKKIISYSPQASIQIEGISMGDNRTIYFTSETNSFTSAPATLYKYQAEEFATSNLSFQEPELTVIIHQALQQLRVESQYPLILELFSVSGQHIRFSTTKKLDIKDLAPGIYMLLISVPFLNYKEVQKIWLR